MKMGSKKVVCFEMMRWPASARAGFRKAKVIIEKSCSEVSLMEQDTIENVS